MAKVLAVAPMPGVKDVWSLLDFIRDEKKYRSRLETLETTRTAINSQVEAVGTIKEIDSLVVQARVDRANAATILVNAKTEASTTISEAKNEAARLIDAVQAELSEDKSRNDNAARALAEREKVVAGKEEGLDNQKKAAGVIKVALDTRETRLVEQEADYKTRAEKLRVAIG